MVAIFSIYNSIDGEVNGFSGIGEPTTFIRLKNCNLHCSYCDSQYVNQEKGLGLLTVKDILSKPLLSKVTITGGEPLLQREELLVLVRVLLDSGRRISIETNGTLPIFTKNELSNISITSLKEDIVVCKHPFLGDCRCRFIVDYKLNDLFEERNFELLCKKDVLKFVVGTEEQYKFAKQVLLKYRPNCLVAFSPIMEQTSSMFKDGIFYDLTFARQLAEWVVRDSDDIPCRTIFSLQLHKVLWPDCSGTNER